MSGDVTIGPIQHSNSMCQKDGCTCWCQACERHNWRHDRADPLASEDVDACGNCHHGKDDHSSRGAERCGIPWCQCPGYLTVTPPASADVDAAWEALWEDEDVFAYFEDKRDRARAQHRAEVAAAIRAESGLDVERLLDITHEDDGSWSVSIKAMPGHVGAADTLAQAYIEANDAAEAWVAAICAEGLDVERLPPLPYEGRDDLTIGEVNLRAGAEAYRNLIIARLTEAR